MKTITDVYKRIRNSLELIYEGDGEIRGKVKLTDDTLDDLKFGIEFEIVKEDAIVADKVIAINELVANDQLVEFFLTDRISPELNNYYISNKINNFWLRFSKKLTIPSNLYIHELYQLEDFKESELLDFLKYAILVHEVLIIAKDYSIHTTSIEKEYFYYSEKPLTIRVMVNGISNICMEEVRFVKEKLEEENHKSMYKSLIKLQLLSLLSSVEENSRFQFLIENFRTFHDNFKSSLDLYYNTFDFNKNKKEMDAKVLDFVKKVYSGVNDIGNKVITIPVAYLLLFTELTKKPKSTNEVLIFFLSIVYCVIIQLSISNQYNYLDQLKNEKEDILSDIFSYTTLNTLLEKYNKKLIKGFKIQFVTLTVLTVVLWLLPITILMFLLGVITLN